MSAGHWSLLARRWSQVGPPLRPSAQDLASVEEAIGQWIKDRGPPRLLILGVTPELYRLSWREGTNVMAMDRSQAMIDYVWPGPRNAVIRADWTTMPLRTGSRDIALCDSGLSLLRYPDEQRRLVRQLHRVIAPGGQCVIRLFVPPRRREPSDSVLRELLAGKIPDLNQLKLRLDMALQESASEGVGLGSVWDAIHRVAPDLDSLAATIDWSPDHLAAIHTYRDSPIRYHFVGVSDVRRLFCDRRAGFELERIDVPSYELGERCPTLVLRRVETAP